MEPEKKEKGFWKTYRVGIFVLTFIGIMNSASRGMINFNYTPITSITIIMSSFASSVFICYVIYIISKIIKIIRRKKKKKVVLNEEGKKEKVKSCNQSKK